MYALIHNSAIKVGPRTWNKTFWDAYLNENGLPTANVPYVEPSSPLIEANFKIIPVYYNSPSYDGLTDQLAGPTYVINTNDVAATYTVVPQLLEAVRGKQRERIIESRYDAEVSGVQHTLLNLTSVVLKTDRESQAQYSAMHSTMGVLDSRDIKFSDSYHASITKAEVLLLMTKVNLHIQNCFDWEFTTIADLNTKTTNAQIAAMDISCPHKLVT